ncbi:single-stranded DNA-binding protein [Thermodesulfobacteriota bacterium]
MLNQIVLTGNLGDDPTVHYSGNTGEAVANFNLAFHSGRDKDGNNRTGWIRCVCFKRLAEITEQYLHKGARVAIVGNLDENKWTNDEGETRKTMQVICHNIEFIKTDGRGFENGKGDGTPF